MHRGRVTYQGMRRGACRRCEGARPRTAGRPSWLWRRTSSATRPPDGAPAPVPREPCPSAARALASPGQGHHPTWRTGRPSSLTLTLPQLRVQLLILGHSRSGRLRGVRDGLGASWRARGRGGGQRSVRAAPSCTLWFVSARPLTNTFHAAH